MGHGFTQRNMQKVENEREDISKTNAAIVKATGKPPRGWLGPGLTETWETPDILVEEGYDYVCDWVLDDQPVWLKTRTKPIVNIPYTQECNDVAMMLIQHHKASEYYDRAIDQFEQIYEDAADSARIMAIVMHPYIMGAPHRTKYFRKIFEQIRSQAGCRIHDRRPDLRLVHCQRPQGSLSAGRMITFQILNGLTFAALLFVVASGFTLIFGLLRIVNLAHGALYLIGGYIGYTVGTKTGSFLLAGMAAMAGVAFIGLCAGSGPAALRSRLRTAPGAADAWRRFRAQRHGAGDLGRRQLHGADPGDAARRGDVLRRLLSEIPAVRSARRRHPLHPAVAAAAARPGSAR